LMKWAWDTGKQHCRWVYMRISSWCCRRHHSSGKLRCIAEWIVADVLKGLSFFIFGVKHCNKIAAWPCRWQHMILQNVGNYWLSDTAPPPGRLASSLHMRVWEYVWSALLLCIQEILGSSLSMEMWFLTVVLVYLRPWPLPPHSQQCILHWLLSYYMLLYSLSAVNPLKSGGHYMYHQFNINQFYVLPTQCIYVFCVDLRTNSDYLTVQHWLVGFYNLEGEFYCGVRTEYLIIIQVSLCL
jgi:hypothetical protein